jgi:hypothetical protein
MKLRENITVHLQKILDSKTHKLKIYLPLWYYFNFFIKTNIMAKSKDSKKAVKKEATKTLKEKRAEKKAKKNSV